MANGLKSGAACSRRNRAGADWPCCCMTKEQNCLVYLLGGPAPGNFKQWLNCRVELRGINASRMNGSRLESGLLFVPGPDEIKIIEPAGPSPSQIPVVSIGSLLQP